jgi:hypothetical protein
LLEQEPAAWIGKMQEEMQEIPVFRPTAEEFEDPYAYLRSIAAEGAKCVLIEAAANSRACML